MKFMIAGLGLLTVLAMVQAKSETCTMQHCSSCIDYSPQCMMCPVQTAKTDDLMKCVECPDNCVECEAPTEDSLRCTECKDSYFIDTDGECMQCDPNCQDCVSVDLCGVCQVGYFLKEGSCTSCPSKCASCNNAESCSVCIDGAYSDGTCKSCPANAAACRLVGDVVTVSACDAGYVINKDSTACLRCQSKCSSCSNEVLAGNDAKCTGCKDNFYLSSDDCAACQPLCKECDASTCSECVDEYTLKDASVSTCQKCTTNKCIECLTNAGGETCTECAGDFYLDGAGACKNCLAKCIDCDDGDTCNKCAAGYDDQTKADNTVACMQLPANCATLDAAGASDDAKCDSCVAGYFVVEGACTGECIDNCDKCNDAATCTTCAAGYSQQNDGTDLQCMALPANCNILKADANVVTPTCEACDPGFFVDTPDCSPCVPNCGTCTDAVAADAVACDAGGCKEGYYILNDLCAACSSDCAVCTDDTTCTTCKAGYGLTSENTCEECGEFCEDCLADVNACVDCKNRTIESDGVCYECPDHCDVCSYNEKAVCTDCALGYTVVDGECMACPSLCDECVMVPVDGEQILSCTDCSDGYGGNSYSCASCPTNCEECSYVANKGVQCSVCDAGYVVLDGLCEACPSNCLECDTKGVCKDCSIGYGLSFDRLSCVVCSELTIENCALCSDYPAYQNDSASCLMCATGYYLEDQIGNGTDARCLEVTQVADLECGDGVVVTDLPPMCEPGKCDPGFRQMDGVCGKPCFRCGDVRIGATVPAEDCITENSTGVMFDFCPDGVCYSARVTIANEAEVMAGCTPPRDTCDVSCIGNADVRELCVQCCSFGLCNTDANVLDSFSSATCLSSALTLLLLPLLLLLK